MGWLVKLIVVGLVFPGLFAAFLELLLLPSAFVTYLLSQVAGHAGFWERAVFFVALLAAGLAAGFICKLIWPRSGRAAAMATPKK